MAHAILGAATSYATGQDIGIGALSAVSSETAAPALSKFLFGKDSKELTQDEKDTITNIITLATASTAYAITDGDVAGSVSAAEVGKGAVENNYLYHESALKNSKLNNRQRRHIELLKKAGAISYESIEAKFNNCKGDKACEDKIKKEWHKESERTRQIERDLVAKGELTWEDFDRIEGGFIGTDTPHLAAIQNKRHALAQSEVFSWNQPDQQAQLEAIRNDGGVTPDSNEDLFMQAGIGTLGTVGTGRSQRAVQTNKSSASASDRAAKGSKDLNIGNNNINYEKSLHDKINDKLPIKISGKFKPQEEKDAIRFAQQQGGGSFKFSDNKNQQGIEGVFIGKTGVEYPVSLKRLTTTNTKKVQTKIAENAQQIYRAENLPKGNPHKLPSGTLEKTTIHVRLTNITKEQMISDLNSYPINGISTRFDKIILDTNNGRIIINRGKILEVK